MASITFETVTGSSAWTVLIPILALVTTRHPVIRTSYLSATDRITSMVLLRMPLPITGGPGTDGVRVQSQPHSPFVLLTCIVSAEPSHLREACVTSSAARP